MFGINFQNRCISSCILFWRLQCPLYLGCIYKDKVPKFSSTRTVQLLKNIIPLPRQHSLVWQRSFSGRLFASNILINSMLYRLHREQTLSQLHQFQFQDTNRKLRIENNLYLICKNSLCNRTELDVRYCLLLPPNTKAQGMEMVFAEPM